MRNLLMISGDRSLASGKQGAFYNTLEEFHKHWDRIDVICPRSVSVQQSPVESIFGNVFIHASSWPLLFQVKFIFRKGREIFKNHKFDLITVHEYAPFYNGLGAYLLSITTKVPYVLEIMHIPGLPKIGSKKEFIYKYWTMFFMRFDTHRARAVRVINQRQTKDFLVQNGVPSSKIKYIPAFYIDFNTFKPESAEKKFDIIYVARLEHNKGIINLLKAIQIIRDKNPGLKVCLVGNGPLRNEIERFIHAHGLEGCVEMAGWLQGPQDVARLLNQSRVFVNPSLNEGGPRVALEAMACGIPVVTTRVGLMVDIIEDGKNGLFCDWKHTIMAQTIERMLEDESLRQICSLNAQETVKLFEKKKAVKNYADELQTLIQ